MSAKKEARQRPRRRTTVNNKIRAAFFLLLSRRLLFISHQWRWGQKFPCWMKKIIPNVAKNTKHAALFLGAMYLFSSSIMHLSSPHIHVNTAICFGRHT
jgi:hypothetical protein